MENQSHSPSIVMDPSSATENTADHLLEESPLTAVPDSMINGQPPADPSAAALPDSDAGAGPDPTLTAPPDDIVYPPELPKVAVAETRNLGGIIPDTVTPIYVQRRTVSGSYTGTAAGFRLDLRVDVDRAGKLNLASFDFFSLSSVVSYLGSYVVNTPAISYTTTQAVIDGFISGTNTMWANRVRIQIPRNLILSPAGAATVTFYRNTTAGNIYVCNFQSSFFRTVSLETDVEQGTSLLGDYNTGTFTNPGPTRVLNVVKAFQEAGVNMVYTGRNNMIRTSESGTDSRWTESELHASMVNHFSVFRNQSQWAVWLFAARRATSSTLLGIMFDYLGQRPHRQGCAVFQDTLKAYHPNANDYNRNLLYTYVHELGHAFNLLHSWDKSRPRSLSWMNYPWKFDQLNGAGNFWNNFTFAFDAGELRHLRHGFRNAVIMGGNDWAVGAGHEAPHSHSDLFATDMVENNTGLKLELEPAKKSFSLSEPVVTEIKLRCMDLNGKTVNAHLHPKYEQVKIGILKPNGQVVTYEPVAHHCVMPKMEELTPEHHTLYASAYIGYGQDGFYFDQPGFYRLKAAYLHTDGSVIQSEEVTIRVKSPFTKAEDEIADLYFSDEAGMVFYLLGSDSPSLQGGMEDLELVREKYSNHDLAVYANLVLGVNESMRYKTVDAQSGEVKTRGRDLEAATTDLQKVFEASKGEKGIDNLTLNWAYRQLAKGFVLEDDEKRAKAILEDMKKTFKAKKLKPEIQETIAAQSDKVLQLQ